MSTILKALRRLEQERSKDGERPLREQVAFSRARRRGPWAAWAAAGVALAVGFAATWAVLATLGAPAPEPEAASAPLAAVAAAPPGSPTRSGVIAPPAAPPTPTVRVAAGAPPLVPAPAPAPAPGAAAAPRTLAPAPGAPIARPAPAASPRVAVTPPPTPPTTAPVPAPREEPVLTAPIPGRASRFVDDDETPRAARADVPVDVVRTSWHPQAERRSAWIAVGGESPREVREGEWVGAYEVRAIEPDGILFADGPLLVHRPVGQR